MIEQRKKELESILSEKISSCFFEESTLDLVFASGERIPHREYLWGFSHDLLEKYVKTYKRPEVSSLHWSEALKELKN